MIGRLLLAGVLLASAARGAEANGRPPGVATINFRRGMESEILVGGTFGAVKSIDGGATWRWICEDAIGYGGMYDPDYAYSSMGTLFATTFTGLKANRDGCQFEQTPSGTRFVSNTAIGADGAVYFSAADLMDGKVYKSTDDGKTFPLSAMPGTTKDWWQSLEPAPSDPNRLYLAGFRSEAGLPKVFLMYRSNDGGLTWVPQPVGAFATMPNSTIEIVGVSQTDPNLVYARVSLEDNTVSDAIYRSTDGAQSWTRILGKPEAIAFLVRRNGDLVAATKDSGTVKSTDGGMTWQAVAGAPHINCLAENTAGEVWACTRNYSTTQLQGDDAAVMKSKDLAAWTKVMRFQDLLEPVACNAGTPQHDTCDVDRWCGLCAQLGCKPNRDCPGVGPADMAPSEGGGGCCEASGGGAAPGAFALTGLVAFALMRPRRRARR